MNITAIWIIDENYVMPAYASICSFVVSIDIPIVVVYCGDKDIDQTKKLFEAIDSKIAFDTFNTPAEFINHPQKSTITNRLARMHYADKAHNELVLLVDADVLLATRGALLIDEIAKHYKEGISNIFGVLDAKIAYRDYLYFNTKDENGRDVPVPHLMQKDIYNSVFGENWWHHLKGASLNNGIIAFYRCSKTIKYWKEFYMKGLKHTNVNPGDDQLPLAAAIHKTLQNVSCLSDQFNSKGEIIGNYIVYHALSSSWKMQFLSAIKNEEGVSDFADIAKSLLHKIPKELKDNFIKKIDNVEPYLYKKLEGKFGYKHLYEDIISGIENGRIAEIGSSNGKSACFMLELIANSTKDIAFHMYSSSFVGTEHFQKFTDITKKYKLAANLNMGKIDVDSDHDERIDDLYDFVFLNFDNQYESLFKNLKYWYHKLKPGGILAGYDYTSQIGLKYGNKCATFDFCEAMNLPLRISFDIFIIEKPTTEIISNNYSSQLLTSNSTA